MTMQQQPDLLSVSETARLVRMSESTVKRWADAGDLPCQRTGRGDRLFRAADVETLVRERSRG